jgi:hypothetical protein
MNFDNAIAAHSSWKRKLAAYVQKPDRSLNAAEIGKDNQCELGKWIVDLGAQFSTLPEFAKLKSEHARFHKAAADVIRRADAGAKVSGELAIDAKSEFMNASREVVTAIAAMKSKA